MSTHPCPGCQKDVRWKLAFCASCSPRSNPAWDDYVRSRGTRRQLKEREGICLDCRDLAMPGYRYCAMHREKRVSHCAKRRAEMRSATVAVVLLLASVSHAQVVVPQAQTMVDGADLVVAARIEGVSDLRVNADDGSWSESTIVSAADAKLLKGTLQTTAMGHFDFTIPGGSSSPLAHFPTFKVGEEYLLLFRDGKLLHAELGAVPVDLEGTPSARSLTPGETESLDDALRRRFNLAPPKPSPAPTAFLDPVPLEHRPSDDGEWRARFEAWTEPAIGPSPGPWRYFYESPPLVANPPTLTLTQVTRSDDVLGHETTRRALRLAVDALSAASGIHVNLSETIGNESRGYYCGPGLRILFNDPAEELTPNSGCGGVLAVGGPCPGGTGVLAGGSVLMADDWGNCSLWGETNVAAVILHELMHAIGLKHSYETSEQIITQYQRDAQIAPFLKLGVGAQMFAYDRDATAFLYGPEGNPQPTATAGPTRTPGPTPTFIPTQTPRDPRACPKPATVVGGKCQCPSGTEWNKPKSCPRRGGKFSVKCACVDASIGIGPKGCSDG